MNNSITKIPQLLLKIGRDNFAYINRMIHVLSKRELFDYYTNKYISIKGSVKRKSIQLKLQNEELPEVHTLSCKKDFYMSINSLYSFYTKSDVKFPLIIHDDGSLTKSQVEIYKKIFVGCRIVSREEADRTIQKAYARHDWLLKWRDSLIFTLKLIDASYFAVSNRIIMMDSDVFFFQKPLILIEAALKPPNQQIENYFLKDIVYAYSHPKELLFDEFGDDFPLYLNAGFCMYDKRSFNICIIKRLVEKSHLAINPGWVEQTAFAAISHKWGYRLLPENQYQAVTGKTCDRLTVVMRHYISTYRFLYYVEAL